MVMYSLHSVRFLYANNEFAQREIANQEERGTLTHTQSERDARALRTCSVMTLRVQRGEGNNFGQIRSGVQYSLA